MKPEDVNVLMTELLKLHNSILCQLSRQFILAFQHEATAAIPLAGKYYPIMDADQTLRVEATLYMVILVFSFSILLLVTNARDFPSHPRCPLKRTPPTQVSLERLTEQALRTWHVSVYYIGSFPPRWLYFNPL